MKIRKKAQSAGLVATVVDSLESQSSTDGLSANQGRILNEKITNAITYSTKEINTGKKWVDGRDIYSKTFFFTMPNDDTLQLGMDISNFDRMIDLKSTWKDTVDAKWFSNVRFDTSTFYIKFGVSKSYIWVEGKGTDWSSRTSDACITIEYVKVEE